MRILTALCAALALAAPALAGGYARQRAPVVVQQQVNMNYYQPQLQQPLQQQFAPAPYCAPCEAQQQQFAPAPCQQQQQSFAPAPAYAPQQQFAPAPVYQQQAAFAAPVYQRQAAFAAPAFAPSYGYASGVSASFSRGFVPRRQAAFVGYAGGVGGASVVNVERGLFRSRVQVVGAAPVGGGASVVNVRSGLFGRQRVQVITAP